jgi:Cof subfamily protein (haloacid dehalogenase superfamily)
MIRPTQKIKLIAIDIDGTLLNPDQQISPRTKSAIQAAREAGVIVTLATARRYAGAIPVANELGLELPLITYDGALIIHHPTREILHRQPLSMEVAREVIAIFHKYNVQPALQIYHENQVGREENVVGPVEFDNPELTLFLEGVEDRDVLVRVTYDELFHYPDDPMRVVAFASEEQVQHLVQETAPLDCSEEHITRGLYGSAEFTAMYSGTSKASGVAHVAGHFGIPLTQVMALGDNNNDLLMLQSVGWGVAMGQAPAAVRAAANAVTSTNAEDGAAQAIEEYVLERSLKKA